METPLPPARSDDSKIIFVVMLLFFLVTCAATSGLVLFSFIKTRGVEQARSTAAARTGEFVSAKSTAVMRTQQAGLANGTPTHVARLTQEASFQSIEPFDNNNEGWFNDKFSSDTLKGWAEVKNGYYVWTIAESKNGFVYWGNRNSGSQLFSNFDVYVDAKRILGDPSNVCYGLQFRSSLSQQADSYYDYAVCDNGYFRIAYYDDAKNGWSILHGWEKSAAIRANDWNNIGISARGSHFVFTINDRKVAELDDDHLKIGGVGVLIDIGPGGTGNIWFDNYALNIDMALTP